MHSFCSEDENEDNDKNARTQMGKRTMKEDKRRKIVQSSLARKSPRRPMIMLKRKLFFFLQ